MNKQQAREREFIAECLKGEHDFSDATRTSRSLQRHAVKILERMVADGEIMSYTLNKGHVWTDAMNSYGIKYGLSVSHYIPISKTDNTLSFIRWSEQDKRTLISLDSIPNDKGTLDHTFQGQPIPDGHGGRRPSRYHSGMSYRWASPDAGDMTNMLLNGLDSDDRKRRERNRINKIRQAAQDGDIQSLLDLGVPDRQYITEDK